MSGTIDFFDTNILIAATVKEHAHHREANMRLARIAQDGGACATHTLAEAYNNLTRSPGGYGRSPIEALRILNYTKDTFQLVTLEPDEYLAAIEAIAHRAIIRPVVYDALLIACARKIGARHIYTNNLKHFRAIAPDLASRILAP